MRAQPMRVWNKNTKTMTYLPALMPMTLQSGECMGAFSAIPVPHAAGQQTAQNVNPEDYVIMFATGRIDTAGMLVYDADIVEADCIIGMGDDMPDFKMRKTGLVAWSNDVAGWIVFVDNGKENTPYDVDFATVKKLGNFFEKPELLQQIPAPTRIN